MPQDASLKPTCPACGAADGHTSLPKLEPSLPHEHEYEWLDCTNCHSHFALPRRAMDYQAAYDDAAAYTEGLRTFEQSIADAQSAKNGSVFNRSIAADLVGKLPPGRFLDVGMGSGFMLEFARRAGNEVHGIDLSDASRKFVSERIPGASVHKDIASVKQSFTLVTSLEVVEHVENPEQFLQDVKSKMAEGGVLILSMPNVERPFWRRGGIGAERKFWLQGGVGDTSPHHLTRFSAKGLELLLQRAGFKQLHVGHTPLDVVTWLVWDLNVPFAIPMKAGPVSFVISLLTLQRFLMEHLVLPFWRRDVTQGYGIMALAVNGHSDLSLAELFDRTRDDVIARHLESNNLDVLKTLPDLARGAFNRVRSSIRSRMP